MKQQILEALKAKFTGVSDSILSRIADKLAKTTTTAEQVKTVVDGVTFQQVLESYGDSRATEAQQTAVTNYEKKYNLKAGEKVEEEKKGDPTTPPNGGDDVPSWAKTLIDTNKALSDRLNRMETERTTETRRTQLNNIVGTLPENLRKPYQRTSIDSLTDEEFTSLLSEVKTEVEGITTDIKAKGASFGRPGAGAGKQNEELTEAQIKAINARDTSSEDGQPF